ncbi:MAG: hemolysin III family protein [Ruminococcus sp.]|nr:hemolysin III family protein [Ruminococcus sp.]
MSTTTQTTKPIKRYTLGEEIFNSVSHGVGGGLSIAGTVVLIVLAAVHSNAWGVVSSCIFGASLIILYTMSTLYHAITNPTAKKFFRIMDHNTIFFLIAGTYTPITLVSLRGALGWVIFGVIWGMTIIGIVFNSINLEKFKTASLICYIVMGLAILIFIKPMIAAVPMRSIVYLCIGGGFYLFGVIFYVKKNIRYFHSVWHLFTIGGSIFHYFAIVHMILGK